MGQNDLTLADVNCEMGPPQGGLFFCGHLGAPPATGGTPRTQSSACEVRKVHGLFGPDQCRNILAAERSSALNGRPV